MPPELARQLVYDLDAWYRSHTTRQKDLAADLGLRPQQLSELLGLRNNPTGEQALRIAEFLKENTMNTPATAQNPLKRRNLADANDRILELEKALASEGPAVENEQLKARLAQLEAELKTKDTENFLLKARTSTPPGTTAPAVVGAPAAPADPRGTGMRFNPGKPISEMSEIDKLRVQLGKEPDSEKRNTIYFRIKALEAELSGPRPRARLRGV
jgi:transcriptional regulator with XRE-family HTH domain